MYLNIDKPKNCNNCKIKKGLLAQERYKALRYEKTIKKTGLQLERKKLEWRRFSVILEKAGCLRSGNGREGQSGEPFDTSFLYVPLHSRTAGFSSELPEPTETDECF